MQVGGALGPHPARELRLPCHTAPGLMAHALYTYGAQGSIFPKRGNARGQALSGRRRAPLGPEYVAFKPARLTARIRYLLNLVPAAAGARLRPSSP